MSRREGRESEAKRSYSRIEREPSPKRSRRDGKPKTERNTLRNYDLDTLHSSDPDQKLRRRLQDALPLEAPIEPESKVGPDSVKSELKKTEEKENDSTKRSFDPTEVPRSRTYFQHDERDIVGQGGRSFSRRARTERGGWTDTKDRFNQKPGANERDARNSTKRDERTHAEGTEDGVWNHDRFYALEADAPPPARKRPAFREKKIEHGNTAEITATEPGRHSRTDRPVTEDAKRVEWGGRRPYELDRLEKPFAGDRALPHRRETQRVGFSSRERFDGGRGSMGRDRFSGRYGERNQNNNFRTEKWKHDLFDEANKSPSPKNAEDQIAKVEALLAS